MVRSLRGRPYASGGGPRVSGGSRYAPDPTDPRVADGRGQSGIGEFCQRARDLTPARLHRFRTQGISAPPCLFRGWCVGAADRPAGRRGRGILRRIDHDSSRGHQRPARFPYPSGPPAAHAMHGNPRHARALLVGTALLTRNNYADACMEIRALCMASGGGSAEPSSASAAASTARAISPPPVDGARPSDRSSAGVKDDRANLLTRPAARLAEQAIRKGHLFGLASDATRRRQRCAL